MADPILQSTAGNRSGAIIARHLVSEMVLPTLFALSSFGLVVLLGDLYGYSDLIIRRGVAADEVGRLAALQLVPTLTRTLPLAMLVGMLAGLGRLSADRELLAIESVGISRRRLALPCCAFGAGIALIGVFLTTIVAPASERNLQRDLLRLAESSPGLALNPGVTTRFDDWRIEAGRVENGGAHLSQVLVYLPNLASTIFARHGDIVTDDEAHKSIHLEDGVILNNGRSAAYALRFETLETRLPNPETGNGISIDELRAQPFAPLVERMHASSDLVDERRAQIEVHRRLAVGLAAFPLGLLAAGLALTRRHTSRSGGIAIGLTCVIFYYALVQLSEGMLRAADTHVASAMWMPNAVIAALGTLLWIRADNISDGMGASFRSWIPRRLDRGSIRLTRLAYPRYVARRFLTLTLLCLIGLAIASLIVDLSDNLKWFNKYGATLPEIGRFYVARAPVLAARAIPMALLVGCALTISVLGSDGELLGMRACGVPVVRVLMPVSLLCMLAVPLDYLVANELVPRANARASYVNRMEIKNGAAVSQVGSEESWYRFDRNLLEIKRLDLLRGRTSQLTLYDLDASGLPNRRIDAEGARSLGDGRWLLEAPRGVGFHDDRLRRDVPVGRIVELPGRSNVDLDTGELSLRELRGVISELDHSGADSIAYRVDLHGRLAGPWTCVLLPLIALFLSSTGPPFPRPVHSLMLCLVLAIAQAVVASVAASLGHRGVLPPVVAGWSPALLFAVAVAAAAVAAATGLRTGFGARS